MASVRVSRMNWLVTGGAGFVGANLVKRLLADPGIRIRVLDNVSVSTPETLAEFGVVQISAGDLPSQAEGSLEFLHVDVRDTELARRAVAGSDVVVHLAAQTGVRQSIQNPMGDMSTNVIGTLSMLRAARDAGVSTFIFASSGAVLGDHSPPLKEDIVARPISPYGASKLAGEAYCHAFSGSYGLPTVVLRFSNAYGPYSMHKQSVVAKFIKEALAGRPLKIFGEGSQTRDYIFVDDVADAIILAARLRRGSETFQIATQRETTVIDLTEMLSSILESTSGVRPERVHVDPLAGEVYRNYSDISRARDILGWEPTVTLEDGLRRAVDWFWANIRPRS